MSNFIQETIKSLSDDELKQCWNEINQYRKDGMIDKCLLRNIREKIANEIGDKNWDCSCRIVVIPELLYEMARRHYNYK